MANQDEREDIELGTEPIEVERRPRAGVVVSVRLSPEEADELQEIAEARDVTVSKVVREAIVAYTRPGKWTYYPSGGRLMWTATLAAHVGYLEFAPRDSIIRSTRGLDAVLTPSH